MAGVIFAVHTRRLMHLKEGYLPSLMAMWRENSNSPASNSRAHIMLSSFHLPKLCESLCVPPTRWADKQSQSCSGPESWVKGWVLDLGSCHPRLCTLRSPLQTLSPIAGGLLARNCGRSLCRSCIRPLCCVLMSGREALGSHPVSGEGWRTQG